MIVRRTKAGSCDDVILMADFFCDGCLMSFLVSAVMILL